jgi:hypothetical protein
MMNVWGSPCGVTPPHAGLLSPILIVELLSFPAGDDYQKTDFLELYFAIWHFFGVGIETVDPKARNCFHAVKCLQYRSPPDFLRFFQNDIGE